MRKHHEHGLVLVIFLFVYFYSAKCNSDEISIDAPLLPSFNEGFTSVLATKDVKTTVVAAVGNGKVTWTGGGKIDLVTEYHCLAGHACYGEFVLNNSQELLVIRGFDMGLASPSGKPDTFSAHARLTALQTYGAALVGFGLTLWKEGKQTGGVYGQFLVNLQPPTKRIITSGCAFTARIYPAINLIKFQFNPTKFMPTGFNWHQVVVLKRVRLKMRPRQDFIHIPLLVVTRQPFRMSLLNFYYFEEVAADFGHNGKFQMKARTANGAGHQDSGVYTARWFLPNRQHVVDEFCEETGEVPEMPAPLPMAPIIAFTRSSTPEEWSFEVSSLQAKVQTAPREPLIACTWLDVFQKVPVKKKFTLIATRYAFYSEGEDLGFLMYAYMSQLRLPSLEGLICHTKATTEAGVGAYAPCPQDKDTLSVFPSVSPDNQYMRFVVRGDFVCRRIRKPKGITRVEVTNLVTGTNFDVSGKSSIAPDSCANPHQTVDVRLPSTEAWRQGTVYKFKILTKSNDAIIRLAVMDHNNEVIVDPEVATYTQMVKISCFKGRLAILENAWKGWFDKSQMEYMEMHGHVGHTKYVLIASYNQKNGFMVDPENIHGSAKLEDTRSNGSIWLSLNVLAYHITEFQGFRCRLKMRHNLIPLHEVTTIRPMCFIRRPPPIHITVNNATVPDTSNDLVLSQRELQVFQMSCVEPGEQLVFTCSDWIELDTCPTAPNADSVYDIDTDLLIYVKRRKQYVLRSLVYDRLGRGQVKITAIESDWHVAEVVCHQTISMKGSKSRAPIIEQYSSAVRLCVSDLAFTFYSTHVGFDKESGLVFTVEELKRRQALDILDTRSVHALSEGSAVLCEVTDQMLVKNTRIQQENRGGDSEHSSMDGVVRIFGMENVSIAILPEYDPSRRLDSIPLYCETTRATSNIPARSQLLRVTMIETSMKKTNTQNALDGLFSNIVQTTVVGVSIGAICPLVIMLREKAYARKKARKKKTAAKKRRRLNYLKEMGLSTTTTAGQKSSTRSNRRSVGQDDASQASEDPNRIEDDDSFMDMVEGDERKKTGLFGALTNWK